MPWVLRARDGVNILASLEVIINISIGKVTLETATNVTENIWRNQFNLIYVRRRFVKTPVPKWVTYCDL